MDDTGNAGKLPLAERARRGLLLSEPDLALDELLALEHPTDLAARKALRTEIEVAIQYGSLNVRLEEVQDSYLPANEYIDRESYRAWRATCPATLLSPLSQVFKWLGATSALPESNGGASEKVAALQSLLAEIDRRAAEKNAGFNRYSLLGTKAEFHELLKAYCPAFRYIGLSATADYLKGVCKFQQGAKPQHAKGKAIWALFPEYPDLKLG